MNLNAKQIVITMQNIVWPISIALLGLFLLLAAIYAVSKPLCCADDASIAVVSKNLASGLGYLSTVNYWGGDADYRGELFDPGISTGVTSVLSVAIGIYFFGSKAAVPGLVHILIYFLIIMAVAFKFKNSFGKGVAGGVLAIFIFLIASTSGYHFEHWYSQLGEVLSVLLVILGLTVLILTAPNYRAYFVAGLLMGCGVLTKHIAVLYVAGAAIMIAYEMLSAPPASRSFNYKLGFIFISGVCFPIFLFELWKISVLGVAGWLGNWQKYYQFLLQAGVVDKQYHSIYEMMLIRLDTLHKRFFISPLALSFALVAYPFLLISLPPPWRRLSFFLTFGFILHTIYWVWLSNGWARYIYMAVIVGGLLVAIAQIAGKGMVARLLMGLSIIQIVSFGLPKLDMHPLIFAKPNGVLNSAQIIADYIELNHQQEPVHTQWWAHTAALEYLSSVPHRYSLWNEPRNRSVSERLIVTDSRFLIKDDASFKSFLERYCIVEYVYENYTLHACR